jgi:hypothetical protein
MAKAKFPKAIKTWPLWKKLAAQARDDRGRFPSSSAVANGSGFTEKNCPAVAALK